MKKFVISLLVCLVACCSVFALNGISDFLGNFSQEEARFVQPAEVLKENSTVESKKTSNAASTALTDLEGKKSLKGDALAEHKENLETLARDFDLLEKYRNSIHPFANGGLRIGFKDAKIKFGVVANGGLKFANGLSAQLGIGYDLLTLNNGFKFNEFKLDNWDATITVGYQW